MAITVIFSLILSSIAADPSAVNKNQLETFYIWKLSDELALDVHQEQKFAEITRSLNSQKNELSGQMQASLEKLKTLSGKTPITVELKNYRTLQKKYLQVADLEIEKMTHLLGPERTAKYLIEKQNLTNKLKSVLANPSAIEKPAKMPPPKIIQEK